MVHSIWSTAQTRHTVTFGAVIFAPLSPTHIMNEMHILCSRRPMNFRCFRFFSAWTRYKCTSMCRYAEMFAFHWPFPLNNINLKGERKLKKGFASPMDGFTWWKRRGHKISRNYTNGRHVFLMISLHWSTVPVWFNLRKHWLCIACPMLSQLTISGTGRLVGDLWQCVTLTTNASHSFPSLWIFYYIFFVCMDWIKLTGNKESVCWCRLAHWRGGAKTKKKNVMPTRNDAVNGFIVCAAYLASTWLFQCLRHFPWRSSACRPTAQPVQDTHARTYKRDTPHTHTHSEWSPLTKPLTQCTW